MNVSWFTLLVRRGHVGELVCRKSERSLHAMFMSGPTVLTAALLLTQTFMRLGAYMTLFGLVREVGPP